MNYLPLGMEFFLVLAMAGVVILVLLAFDVLSYAYRRIGISVDWMAVILLAALIGSYINIPVARLRGEIRRISARTTVFGVTYRVPAVVEEGRTTIAVNVGGPLCPPRWRST